MRYAFGVGLPSEEQRDNMEGIYSTDRKCPKCKSEIKFFDGGDQGGVPHDYCVKCSYEKY